jgi:hypothetical protein
MLFQFGNQQRRINFGIKQFFHSQFTNWHFSPAAAFSESQCSPIIGNDVAQPEAIIPLLSLPTITKTPVIRAYFFGRTTPTVLHNFA